MYTDVTYRIFASNPLLQTAVEYSLGEYGIRPSFRGEWDIILDLPTGFALNLEEQTRPGRILVLGLNPCPEYRLDLADGGAHVFLLSEIKLVASFLKVSSIAKSPPKSILSLSERKLLRRIAFGYAQKKIAKAEDWSPGTVRNLTSSIYDKLHLSSHSQLSLYYFGHWGILLREFGWRPPL
jgi:DNA-binding CsgD family transcriptional regulator